MSATLRQTPLHDAHVALGARMVPFAGWEMPVQYEGVIPEHMAVRTRAGAFDVSHMGQLHVDGPGAQAFLQSVLSNDVDRVQDGGAQYTLLTTESGGIVDDLIVYRLSHGCYLLVVNAGNREDAYEWLKEREPRGVEVRDASDEYGLVAVQGPSSLELLGLDDAPAFTHAMGEVAGIEAMICRTGYTGEKGVELLCPAEDAVDALERRARAGRRPLRARCARHAAPRGLLSAARERPHAGDRRDLGRPRWVCALDTEFTGADALRQVKEHGPERRLVAFVMQEKAIPRHGMAIAGGGEVTSGTHSPIARRRHRHGLRPSAQATAGTELELDVRGRPRRARVVEKPIYKKER